jgi:epoxyqueuosine reductase
VAQPMELEEKIQTEAKRLGFILCGITRPDSPLHWPTYEGWIAAGRQATMAYLASEPGYSRRANPSQVLPTCRSIIVLGILYSNPGHLQPPAPAVEKGALEPLPCGENLVIAGGSRHSSFYQKERDEKPILGRIAAYAWGDDYHLVIPVRLKALAEFIASHSEAAVAWRGYTDTGPILERDLAQKAGLGWIGKNTCLIHPLLGSFFLLAELFLDQELVPTLPFLPDHCGKCTRCIAACPTGCILPDRTLDARRCLSYLTIEHKGPIPSEMRPYMKEWIFGCDICQMVCPWNHWTANHPGDQAFNPRPGVPFPNLRQELRLTSQEFNTRFRGSPVQRPRRRGYLRNVALALGNAGDPAAVPDLVKALATESEPVVRGAAAWALRRLDTPEASAALKEALTHEMDEGVRKEILSDRN